MALTGVCDGCGVTVSIYDLSQADTKDAPRLCLVCVHPKYYRYDDDVPQAAQGELPI